MKPYMTSLSTLLETGPGSAVFDYQPRPRILFGANSIERLGDLARDLGGRRVLVVTDAGIVAAGHLERARHALEDSGLEIFVYDKVVENPTTRCVDQCLEVAKSGNIDLLVGLGGGSSLDTARGCNFLLTNGGKMRDYLGVGKASKPMLPMIAIPTTAGTGSEAQSFALIADEQTHLKMACGDPKAAAKIAILDPTLTLSLPSRVTAAAGIDAVTHAVESAVTRKRTPFSMMFAREAFRLTSKALPVVFEDPKNLEARGEMLLGASLAGLAIENSMLGAAHSAANPLTAHFNVVHGQAVSVMLPWVMKFNTENDQAAKIYHDLSVSAGITSDPSNESRSISELIEFLENLIRTAGLKSNLESLDVRQDAIPLMAEEAERQWTAQFNPREIGKSDFVSLYEAAYSG